MSAGVNEPVQCGGVAVVPGDVIFGDKYGVIAIPPHMVEAVIAHMQGKGEMEEWIRRKIRSGGDLHHYYQHPPIPEVVQEYERERQAGAFAHANGSPA